MNTSELKTKLAEEMSDLAPDRLDDLLRACADREHAPRVVEAPQRPRRSMPRILAVAAVFVLLIGGILGYRAMDASRCIVTVDVNPSVSLTVNRFNRIKEVTPLNADAETLLDGIDLKGTRLHRAMEMLTSALIDQDYLSGTQNAMLVSVENATAGRAEALCETVVSTIEETAVAHLFHTAVLYQRISGETDIQAEAEARNVSVGKAVLADALAAQMEDCPAERLSMLSIQDLLFLADARGVTFENASLFGTVSRIGYCDRDAAAVIALKNAGLSGVSAPDFTASFDGRDGELVYIVCFSDGTYAYRYTISAKSGTILDVARTGGEADTVPEQNNASGTVPSPATEETPNLIDPMDALRHVLQLVHHTVEEIQNLNIQTEWIENTPFYRVSFEIGGRAYQFYVDARTNDIF